MDRLSMLEMEQQAFEKVRAQFLPAHRGQFVLFKDGSAVAFFADHATAYAAGVERFGPDAVFLVTPVDPPPPRVISYAWTAGVMFG